MRLQFLGVTCPVSSVLVNKIFALAVAFMFVHCLMLSDIARADFSGVDLITDVTGLRTQIVFAPGETDRIFSVGRSGDIRIVDLTTNTELSTPFLSVPNVDIEGEGGAIALAFHPDYQNNGKFYLNVTLDNGGIPIEPIEEGVISPFTSHLFEYTVSNDPSIANPTPTKIIEWVQPKFNHNSGWMGFGPNDGYLYVTTGDGGTVLDSGPGHTPDIGNAQDITDNLFGKIIRIDVDGPDAYPADPDKNYAIPSSNPFVGVVGDDEIWAYGLRNPFRASFDRATGDLYLGDVGENTREEIDVLYSDSSGGENYGWRLREGTAPTNNVGGPPPPGNVEPLYDYLHAGLGSDPDYEGNSVTAGYVYRGPDPEIQGIYIFADFVSGNIWTFDPDDPYATVENITDTLPVTGGLISSFAEDAHGNLFVTDYLGKIYRILTDSVVPGDFDENARVDDVDQDTWQANFGVLVDAVHADGDTDNDGDVDGVDFLEHQRSFGYDVLNVSPPAPAISAPEPSTFSIAAIGLLAFGLVRRLRAHLPLC